MGLFVCDKCHALENTSLGHFWSRSRNLFGEEHIGKAYCMECMPDTYLDGSSSHGGKWHDSFPKKIMTKESVAEMRKKTSLVYVPKELLD